MQITREQLETIHDLKSQFTNVTSINLENKTPAGLEVTFYIFPRSGRFSQVIIYSLNSDGEHVFIDSYFNK